MESRKRDRRSTAKRRKNREDNARGQEANRIAKRSLHEANPTQAPDQHNQYCLPKFWARREQTAKDAAMASSADVSDAALDSLPRSLLDETDEQETLVVSPISGPPSAAAREAREARRSPAWLASSQETDVGRQATQATDVDYRKLEKIKDDFEALGPSNSPPLSASQMWAEGEELERELEAERVGGRVELEPSTRPSPPSPRLEPSSFDNACHRHLSLAYLRGTTSLPPICVPSLVSEVGDSQAESADYGELTMSDVQFIEQSSNPRDTTRVDADAVGTTAFACSSLEEYADMFDSPVEWSSDV